MSWLRSFRDSESKRRRRLDAALYVTTNVVFALGAAQAFDVGPMLRTTSHVVNVVVVLVVWLLPLAAGRLALRTESGTIRAMGIPIAVVTGLVACVGLIGTCCASGSLEREAEVRLGDRFLVAYTTDYQGALGDRGLELREERPVLPGLRRVRLRGFGTEGTYFVALETVDSRCAEVHYRKAGSAREHVYARIVCVDGAEKVPDAR